MAKPASIRPLGESTYVRMALIAKSGFGKTVLSGTAPNALFLTTDPEGTVSAAGMGSTAEEQVVASWESLNDTYIWLRDEGIKTEGYEWIIVDNITQAQKLAMQDSINKEAKKRPGRDMLVPEQADYQRSQNATIQMVMKFNDLPVNIIYTSHRKGMEDGDGAEYYSAAIQGQQGAVAEEILGFMNLIAFGEVKVKDGKSVRRYYFTHTGPHMGKCRFVTADGRTATGPYVDDLTIPDLMARIERVKTINRKTRAAGGATRRPAAGKTTTAARRRAAGSN